MEAFQKTKTKSQYPCQDNSIPGSRPANWICFLRDWRRGYEADVVERDEVAITDPGNTVSPAPGSSAAFGGVKKEETFLTATNIQLAGRIVSKGQNVVPRGTWSC